MSQQLLDYIKKSREAGQSDEQIRAALLQAGWPESVVTDALAGRVPPAPQTAGGGQRVKCAHCGYVGPGVSGRSTWAQTLAWIAIIFSPLITILYFLFTDPWLCGRCGSKLVEEIDEQGRVRKRSKAPLIILLIAIIIIPIALILILYSIVFVSMSSAREQARDVRRKADMRQLFSAQELYFADNGAYFTSTTMPKAIVGRETTYMPTVPLDPQGFPYGWVDNTGDDQRFCAYAVLEDKGSCRSARYYTASHRGTFEVCDVSRWTLECP